MPKTRVVTPPVESACATRVLYDAQRNELHVQYTKSQAVYVYPDTTEAEYRALLAADSIGRYLNKIFKPAHPKFTIFKPAHPKSTVAS